MDKDYETRMAEEAKKKKSGQLVGLIFTLAVLGVFGYFYYNWQQGKGKRSFESTAEALLKSVNENYKLDKMLEEDKHYTFPSNEVINFDERTLKGGDIMCYKNGDVEFAIYDSEWCAIKTRYDKNINITPYKSGECVIK